MTIADLAKCDHCTEKQLRARIAEFPGTIVAEAAKAELLKRGLKP